MQKSFTDADQTFQYFIMTDGSAIEKRVRSQDNK